MSDGPEDSEKYEEYDESDTDEENKAGDERPGQRLLAEIIAILGGAGAAYLLHRELYPKELKLGLKHYNCPECNNTFTGKLRSCPFCGADFKWIN